MSRTQPRVFDLALDDISLRVTEWPGSGTPVLLLHATGFHSRCWNQVASQLPGVHLYAVDLRFHGGSGRAGEVNWGVMARDVEQLLEALDLRQVIGVGHSIGGYLLARAAAAQLPRFKQLLLVDPVIFAPETYSAKFSEPLTIDPTANPVSRRKNRWQDAGEMYERFKARPPFDTWQDAVLRDYCEYALKEVPGETAFQLACDPLHEASIYLSQHGNDVIHQLLPGLTLPVTVLRAPPAADAMMDFAASPTWPGLTAALPNGREFYFPAMTHFIPMEDPALVARFIREAVEAK